MSSENWENTKRDHCVWFPPPPPPPNKEERWWDYLIYPQTATPNPQQQSWQDDNPMMMSPSPAGEDVEERNMVGVLLREETNQQTLITTIPIDWKEVLFFGPICGQKSVNFLLFFLAFGTHLIKDIEPSLFFLCSLFLFSVLVSISILFHRGLNFFLVFSSCVSSLISCKSIFFWKTFSLWSQQRRRPMRCPLVWNKRIKMQKVKLNKCCRLSCHYQSHQGHWSLKLSSVMTNWGNLNSH